LLAFEVKNKTTFTLQSKLQPGNVLGLNSRGVNYILDLVASLVKNVGKFRGSETSVEARSCFLRSGPCHFTAIVA
jgi:hypothetical protein